MNSNDECAGCVCYSCYYDPGTCIECGNIPPCCYCINEGENPMLNCLGWTEVE